MNSYPKNYSNLSTFKVLFIIYGALGCLFSLFFLMYGFIGAMLSSNFENLPNNQEMPFNPGSLFMGIGIVGFIFVATASVFCFVTANNFAKRKGFGVIFATSIIICFTGILGIVLAIFTLIEIHKPHIKALLKREQDDHEVV